ncbi:MAG: helix-turn-helix transcriptional regulator [Oscillospiraceae bacterium]|jgi:transcriptional regulator with XRE-family HTH domain|nr:helix-turn-helix transcriptional regulator [Oscillospiraceae bacterium]
MATDFSRSLALLRKERGLSQRAAAVSLGVSQALLSHYETGAREPGLPFIVRACDFYGVSADFLLGRTMVRDGSSIDPNTIHDAQADNQNRLGRGSAAAILGRKMVVNAVSILFDLAGRSGSTALTAELTNYFGGAVYKIFRHFYAVSGVGEQVFFSAPNCAYAPAADADMSKSEARLLSILHQKTDPPGLPALSNDSLTAEYPQLVRSLLTLTHQAGDRAAKKIS